MLVFLLGTMWVLTALCREIRFGVTACCDVLDGELSVCASLLRIPVYKLRHNIHRKAVVQAPPIVEAATEASAVAIAKKPSLLASAAIVLTNLRVRTVDAHLHIGSVADPLFTTFAYGSVRVLLYSVLAFLKTRYPNAKIQAPIVPEYRSDRLYVCGSAVVYVSLADLLYGLTRLWRQSLQRNRTKKLAFEKPQG